MASRSRDIAAIVADPEAVQVRESIASLALITIGCIALGIAQVMRPSVICGEEQAVRRLMSGFQHHPLIVLVPAIQRCVDDSPILKWRPWIDKRTLDVGSSAGRNLVQVHRYAQPIGVHSHVARAEYRVGS